jgi:hypothetical protein
MDTKEAQQTFSRLLRLAAFPSHIETTIDSYADRGCYLFFVPETMAHVWQCQADIISLPTQLEFVAAVSGCFGKDMAVVTLRDDRAKLTGSFTEGALVF